ncbi:uncharacterized protein [Miscanthus floridulus]|uniref:uncharacterized protein isoform X2 n=1 Tax=Miscanthus floridulus TaxID=154761 RepID=UPI00345B0D52
MSSVPLLASPNPDGTGVTAAAGNGHESRPPGRGRGPSGLCSSWLGRVVDTEEAWAQLQFAVPMILTNRAYYGIPLVSVVFSGHLGDVQLAGATLGNSWATVTSYALATGLSGALETLCGQAYGARMYRMLGLYLQSSLILSTRRCARSSPCCGCSRSRCCCCGRTPRCPTGRSAAASVAPQVPGLGLRVRLPAVPAAVSRFVFEPSILSTTRRLLNHNTPCSSTLKCLDGSFFIFSLIWNILLSVF